MGVSENWTLLGIYSTEDKAKAALKKGGWIHAPKPKEIEIDMVSQDG